MKNLNLLLLLISVVIYSSCRGPQGPPGPKGDDGLDGGLVFAITDEIEFDFNRNDYSFVYEFPSRYEVYESDAVLAYFLVDNFGDNIDVWEPLPMIYFVNDGTLLYSYDHSFVDIRFFMDANFPLDNLSNEFTNGFIARIVIVPAEFATQAMEDGIDLNSYEETSRYFNVEFEEKDYSNFKKKPLH